MLMIFPHLFHWTILSTYVVLAYDQDVRSHNRHCVQWYPPTTHSIESPAAHLTPWRRNRNVAAPGSADVAEIVNWYVCRVGVGVLGTFSGNIGDSCLVQEEPIFSSQLFELGYIHEDCHVFWHAQEFNALPLPMMTHYVMPSDLPGQLSDHAFDVGICLDVHDRLGVVHSDGRHYASCFPSHSNSRGERSNVYGVAGGYRLLGSYNKSAPYIPQLSLPTHDGADETIFSMSYRYDQHMQSIADLVAEHMDAEARELFTLVTNSTVEDLVEYLAMGRDELNPNGHGGAACMRFLSSDRFIHDVQGNILGLHVLRSMLARKVTDKRRRKNGAMQHPDYDQFEKDGYITRDLSVMNNSDINALLSMVSGYNYNDLPDIIWELRESIGKLNDNNLDLHVDTFAPSWKVWLYAEDIKDEHGPLTYVSGSHAASLPKLRFLYRASVDPTTDGASSYGSFRMGLYGGLGIGLTTEKERTAYEDERKKMQEDMKDSMFLRDQDGVWKCCGCDDDERTYGMPARQGINGKKMTLVVADVSGLHARGLSAKGKVRRTFILFGHKNDGGLQRVNPFTYGHSEE